MKVLALVAPVLVAGTLVTTVVAPGASAASSEISCGASMSNPRPADYSATDVIVHTVAGADVGTDAQYKTTTTKHNAVASKSGLATIPYRISGATPGFSVYVQVAVVLGRKYGTCSTSFTPVR